MPIASAFATAALGLVLVALVYAPRIGDAATRERRVVAFGVAATAVAVAALVSAHT